MLSIFTAKSYSEELIDDLNNYSKEINNLSQNTIWAGSSRDNIVNKGNEFLSEFKTALINQSEDFCNAVNAYNHYEESKRNLDVAKRSYDRAESYYTTYNGNYHKAVAADDKPNIANFDILRNKYLSQMNTFSEQISTYSGMVDSYKNQVNISLENVMAVKLVAQEREFVYFNQTDSAYKDHLYGWYNEAETQRGTIGTSGCGTTSMAMVATYLLGEVHDPVEMSDWSVSHGYRPSGNGTAYAFFGAISQELGINCTQYDYNAVNRDNIVSALEAGKPIIVIMGHGTFTSGDGHYIVLRGLDENGRVIVADPNSEDRSNATWDISTITSQDSGHMWVFDV